MLVWKWIPRLARGNLLVERVQALLLLLVWMLASSTKKTAILMPTCFCCP